MVLNKPYRRIIRPFQSPNNDNYINSTVDKCHIIDNDYAPERVSLIRAYGILEKDLIRTLEYIEPSDENLSTYSHRLYELLLRASTEFEMNCKGILNANNYNKSKKLNIHDYCKINTSSRLSEYEIEILIWSGSRKIIKPFESWKTTHSLKWYQDYNSVKHNRNEEFKLANLENVILAISGVFVVLFSQFFLLSFRANGLVGMYDLDDEGWGSHENSIFAIKTPQNWTIDECYDFDWLTLKNQPDKFSTFNFPA